MFLVDDIGDRDPYELYKFDYGVIKLSSGDIIMALVSEDNLHKTPDLVVMTPCRIMGFYDEEGQYRTSIVKYMSASSDMLMKINRNHVVSVAAMDVTAIQTYNDAVDMIWAVSEFGDDPEKKDNVVVFKPKN